MKNILLVISTSIIPASRFAFRASFPKFPVSCFLFPGPEGAHYA